MARRLGRRLAPRVDADDVLQEVLLIASRHLVERIDRCRLPFGAWLERITLQRLADVRQLHLRSKKRSVLRESWGPFKDDISRHGALAGHCDPDEDSAILAAELKVAGTNGTAACGVRVLAANKRLGLGGWFSRIDKDSRISVADSLSFCAWRYVGPCAVAFHSHFFAFLKDSGASQVSRRFRCLTESREECRSDHILRRERSCGDRAPFWRKCRKKCPVGPCWVL
ncbi:MAG: RNA polymerase sigma factor [Planctomycetales bacterium]